MDVLLLASKKSVGITLISEKEFRSWTKGQADRTNSWLEAHAFKAKPGLFCVMCDSSGKATRVVAGISEQPSLWDIADFSVKLPKGVYHLDWHGPLAYHEWLALGWGLGAYRFTRYKKNDAKLAQLVVSEGSDLPKIKRYLAAIYLARDLINTPAEDMGPAEIGDEVTRVGKTYGAKVTQTVGNDLLKKNYPAIHAVGRASSRAPRLIDLVWGNPAHPRVTLVGKGVCFDTGGLDLKPSSGMYLMKKDMGGAASALAIAQMVMDAKLPVRLRLLIPAVENSVSGNAYRPSDVLTMRSGTTVEVGNTDAEGRLVLADALTEGASENPDVMIDFSTLTGAARTAVGTELAAFFCNDDDVAQDVSECGDDMEDPMWRLPLYKPYNKMLDSKIADLNSAPGTPYAGAITAALFLQNFIGKTARWMHFDFMAWNIASRAGRPEGAEAMAVRAVFRFIEKHVST